MEEFKVPALFKFDKYIEVAIQLDVTAKELGALILELKNPQKLPVVVVDERKKT